MLINLLFSVKLEKEVEIDLTPDRSLTIIMHYGLFQDW
jgi:hypothetical protein